MSNRRSYLPLVILAAVAGVLAAKFWLHSPAEGPPVAPGTPIPKLKVAGWLNLAEGQSVDPAGKLLVIDFWATWCPSCMADLPKLTAIAAKYRPLGVEFVSLTDEGEKDPAPVKKVVDSSPGFTWPVGYGAAAPMMDLDIQGIPTTIVFGSDGRCRWSGYGSYGLEAALDDALATESKGNPPKPERRG